MSLSSKLHEWLGERRGSERERVLVTARLRMEDRSLRCVALNLTRSGAMLAALNPPPVGSDVVLFCDKLEAAATVAWVQHYQFGLAFQQEADWRIIAAIVNLNSRKGAGR